MASLLPTVPRLVFSVIEPISLVVGFLGAVLDPAWFIAEQIPHAGVVPVNDNSIVVAWQLGNLYLLMAFMGVGILYTTSEAKVVRSYLTALWLGDIGHVAFSAYALGPGTLKKPQDWNAMTRGNITFTACLVRIALCLRPKRRIEVSTQPISSSCVGPVHNIFSLYRGMSVFYNLESKPRKRDLP